VRSGWRSPAGVLALAGILLGAGVLGFLLHRLIQPPGTVRAIPPPAPRTGAPAAPSHPIPDTLPEISLPDRNGQPHRLADWAGKPLVVNFWATWCEPCRREIPLLESIHREIPRNAVEIVGIAIDHPDSVTKYAEQMKIDYPILMGEKGGLEAAAAFGMEPMLPFTVFVDAQGRIVTLKIGELHRDEAAFILARLADLGAGRLSLPAAREQVGDYLRRAAVSRAAAGQE